MDFSQERARHPGDDGESVHGAPAQPGAGDMTIVVEVCQARPGTSPPRSALHVLAPARRMQIPCDNPACRGGGFDPVPLALELVDGEPGEVRVVSCEGRAFGPGSSGRGARCDTMFSVRLAVRRGMHG